MTVRRYFLYFFLIVVSTPSTFALKDPLPVFGGNSNIESIFDAATSFTIPLFIFLFLNHGMNTLLFSSFIVLAITDMGLTILFTYYCYVSTQDHFFWIYFIFIETLYIIKYALLLKESRFFKNKLGIEKSINAEEEKIFKKLLLPMLLYITNFIFLGFAIHKNYVDMLNGLFVIVPSIILFIVFMVFVVLKGRVKWSKSISISHLRFSVEFMCSIIFVMISGPSILWIKSYLAIAIVELSLYLERAKDVIKESEKDIGSLQIKLNEFVKEMNMQQGKQYVIELNINMIEKEEKVDILQEV